MGGGLALAAVAFVICAFVQIQIQVSSLNSPLLARVEMGTRKLPW